MVEQKKFEQRTNSGYPLDEVVSALQKCIRRGLEQEALFWAYEIGEGFDDYLWRRLLTIASEDIGIADNFAVVLVGQLYENSRVLIEKRKNVLADRLAIAHAVLYMCRTQKNRYVDDYANYVAMRKERGWRPEIPDVAVDQHTVRGRSLRRGEPFFCEHGSVVEPRVEIGGVDYWAEYCKMCSSRPICKVRRG
jgi:replication-associated recombination protein RarA